MKKLIILPCCKRKIDGGNLVDENITFFKNEDFVPQLINQRNIRFQINPPLNNNHYLSAWDRYDGQLYRRLKEHQDLINNLIEDERLDIIIISALYGVINYNTPISNYDLKMDKYVGFWRTQNVLNNAIHTYCQQNNIDKVYTFLRPETYYKSSFIPNINNIEHTQLWPEDIMGINNIYNQVADMVVEELNQMVD